MSNKPDASSLVFPFPTPPGPGEAIEVAPGVLWARDSAPLPSRPCEVYFLDDGDGWAVVDTGIDNSAARAAWKALLAGPLAGRRLTRLIVTHMHPDHIGLAGWLSERFDIPLMTSQTAYIECLNLILAPGQAAGAGLSQFLPAQRARRGDDRAHRHMGHDYLGMVSALPPTFQRVAAGDRLEIGGRAFDILAGDGHAPEQLMLYNREEKLFLAADQVLAKISPNVERRRDQPR